MTFSDATFGDATFRTEADPEQRVGVHAPDLRVGAGELAVAVDRTLRVAGLALGLDPVELGLAARPAIGRFGADGGQVVKSAGDLAHVAAGEGAQASQL